MVKLFCLGYPGLGVGVRIVICDDHPLFRAGLCRLLEAVPGFEIVGEVERGDQVVPFCLENRPDLIVLDLELPGENGVAVAQNLALELPETPILMLSAFSDANRVRAALRAGVRGYLLKNAPPPEIIDAIHKVSQGKTAIGLTVAEGLAQSLRAEPEEERTRRRLGTLSERELQILRLIAEGESNAGISSKLFISEGTVKNHITSILRKLNLDDRTQAAVIAVKYGVSD